MRIRFEWSAALGAMAALALFGCNKPAKPPAAEQPSEAAATAAAITAEDTQQAEQIFSTRCTPCHGPEGRGNGPASAGLTPPPRNFHNATWQAAVSDEHIEQIIQYGGAAVGKSPAMPPNPDLVDKPVVKALRAKIRVFGKQP